MNPGVTYGFPTWARAHVVPCTPAEVTRYFDDRGVYYSKEYWRKILAGEIRCVKIETWVQICDATGKPLSTFISYEPDGAPPRPRKRPRPKPPKATKPALSFPAPPDPHTYYGTHPR